MTRSRTSRPTGGTAGRSSTWTGSTASSSRRSTRRQRTPAILRKTRRERESTTKVRKGEGRECAQTSPQSFFLPCCELAGGKKWVIGIGVARLDGRSFFPAWSCTGFCSRDCSAGKEWHKLLHISSNIMGLSSPIGPFIQLLFLSRDMNCNHSWNFVLLDLNWNDPEQRGFGVLSKAFGWSYLSQPFWCFFLCNRVTKLKERGIRRQTVFSKSRRMCKWDKGSILITVKSLLM